MGAKQQQEMKARAEHLRKQRDLRCAAQEREAELQITSRRCRRRRRRAPAAPAQPSAMLSGATMHRSAGYSEAKSDSVQEQRAQLSRSLAASMKADLASSGNAEEALFAERAERRADLEATKASLRREVELERAGMRGY